MRLPRSKNLCGNGPHAALGQRAEETARLEPVGAASLPCKCKTGQTSAPGKPLGPQQIVPPILIWDESILGLVLAGREAAVQQQSPLVGTQHTAARRVFSLPGCIAFRRTKPHTAEMCQTRGERDLSPWLAQCCAALSPCTGSCSGRALWDQLPGHASPKPPFSSSGGRLCCAPRTWHCFNWGGHQACITLLQGGTLQSSLLGSAV